MIHEIETIEVSYSLPKIKCVSSVQLVSSSRTCDRRRRERIARLAILPTRSTSVPREAVAATNTAWHKTAAANLAAAVAAAERSRAWHSARSPSPSLLALALAPRSSPSPCQSHPCAPRDSRPAKAIPARRGTPTRRLRRTCPRRRAARAVRRAAGSPIGQCCRRPERGGHDDRRLPRRLRDQSRVSCNRHETAAHPSSGLRRRRGTFRSSVSAAHSETDGAPSLEWRWPPSSDAACSASGKSRCCGSMPAAASAGGET